MSDIESIVGRYLNITVDGRAYRIFYEEAGSGIPLFCLHTAGADSRQFRHMLNDPELTAKYRVVAFDLPWHGRSTPPQQWWEDRYLLTADHYMAITKAVWDAIGVQRPIVAGCSMGGAIVLKAAFDHQDEIRGILGLETTAAGHGRYNDFLHHPAVHGGELCATYTYGLNAPSSPEAAKRENWWYYAQSGPGVYRGDIHFYCNDWDAWDDLGRIDTTKCKVALLSGEYDYSATPQMTEDVHKAIPGSYFKLMQGMGHFPMIENYPDFKPYLMDALAHIGD